MPYFNRFVTVLLIAAALLIAGCSSPTAAPATPQPPAPSPTETEAAAPEEIEPQEESPQDEEQPGEAEPTPTVETMPEAEALPAEPQRIEFTSEDGTALVGLYWPADHTPAAGVLLLHQFGRDKESWLAFATYLQGRSESPLTSSVAGKPSYAVFAFDFRGHGESGGNSSDRAGMVNDAKAALATFRGLEGVDPDRIAMIGTSVGADGAADGCGDGCVGVASLSPGGFLGVNYNDALGALGDKPVLCVAAQDDRPSPETCENGEQVGLSDYQVHIYEGGLHGIALFDITDQTPLLVDLLTEWLIKMLP